MSPQLYGHEAPTAQLQSALSNGRLHHAYLLAGPKGLGKSAFARAWVPKLLEGGDQSDALLASGAHPDFMTLALEQDPKTGKQRRDITRDQVERLLEFLGKHAVLSKRKIVLIDAADDLNVNAANNLLKWLEEPRPHTCLLLIAHRVDRLLPTIRSRCAKLTFQPLGAEDFDQFCAQNDLKGGSGLYELSGGVPGQALILADPGVQAVHQALSRFAQNMAQADPMALAREAPSLLVTKDAEGLDLALRLLRHALRDQAGTAQEVEGNARLADAYQSLRGREAEARALNLDPVQVLTRVLLDLQSQARQGQAHAA